MERDLVRSDEEFEEGYLTIKRETWHLGDRAGDDVVVTLRTEPDGHYLALFEEQMLTALRQLGYTVEPPKEGE